MPTQSEAKWSDKHHRYLCDVVGNDGTIMDTIWLGSAPLSPEPELPEIEATEPATIPSSPVGDLRYVESTPTRRS
jgi:hypothetical protein